MRKSPSMTQIPSMPVLATRRCAVWPWSLAGAAFGLILALVVFGLSGSELHEGAVHLTLFCAAPTAWLLTGDYINRGQWWLFVLVCWPVQGLLLGTFVGWWGRSVKRSRLRSWLILIAASIGLPLAILLLLRLG